MENFEVFITCDMGEGLDNEPLLMPYIDSCSIACGYHAGNVDTMSKVVLLAQKHNKFIGAHPSFPDREGFGRREMKLPKAELVEIIKDQIDILKKICVEKGAALNYVKPHGALYNVAVTASDVAEAVIQAVIETDKNLWIYTPSHGLLAQMCLKNKIQVKYEAFADRNYQDNLNLVSRSLPDAVIDKPEKVIEHVSFMIKHHSVKTITGKLAPIKAEVLCVHGDNPNTILILKELHKWKKNSFNNE